jgi:amino acid transporter
VLATAAILLVALCISRFARYSSSPGSLYTYASMILPPSLGATAAWSLLLAYIATGSSVIGGFYHYANLLLHDATGRIASAVFLALLVTAISIGIAWRDVKISARLMLWIEAVSVTLIVTVVSLVLLRHGLHLDWTQLRLRGMTGSGLRLGLVLALFSFVGFESATTLGAEARNPLRTIPRAVIQSALLAGAIFILCAYTEVLGLRTVGQDLGKSEAPMRVLASVGGVPILGLLIDIGVLVSMFAGTLACITAAARVLLLMAHNGLMPGSLRVTHARHETPGRAIMVTGIASVAPVAVLAARGASGLDVYGWMGSLATYGFIVAYALVCVALPRYLRDHGAYRPGARIIPWLAFTAMLLALIGNLYPIPEGPYGKLPFIYLAYLCAGMVWFLLQRRREEAPLVKS